MTNEKHTAGPWRWNVNVKSKCITLESQARGSMLETVMGFDRWGMGGAMPMFRSALDIMVPAHSLTEIVPGREHHADWYRTLAHPDARLIARAPDLLVENERLRKALKVVHDWRGLCDSGAPETWERIASMFYDDAGMLRPGKDQAMALGGHPTDEERRAAWDVWVKRKNDELDAEIRAALEQAK